MKKQNNKGFTLIELLVVVAIIGILAAVGTVAYNGYTSAAKKSVIKNNHAAINKFVTAEITMCMVDYDREIIKLSDGTGLDCDNIFGNVSTNTVTKHLVKYVQEKYKNVYNKDYNVANQGWMHNNPCNKQGSQDYNNQEVGTHTLGLVQYGNIDPFFIIDSCFSTDERPLRNKTIIYN